MKKHFNLRLTSLIVLLLLGVLMVVTACKKNKELISSAPAVDTWYAINISQTWATMEGSVNANNQSAIVTFEYDTTTSSYRNSIKATPDTINGSTYTDVSAFVTGLASGTKYHFRIKAVNSNGTTYGSDTTFTTAGAGGNKIIFNPDLTYGSLSDNDGNTYKTIQIGTQTWMAENLKTTKYNDGTAIQIVKDAVAWTELITPGYCWYANDTISYGAMYNWYTVSTGNLCPEGWHVPSDADWAILTTYLGGDSISGTKLKEIGVTHWQSPNTGATNESGYAALPGGYRSNVGIFGSIRKAGYFWSSTENSSVDANCHGLFYDSGNFTTGNSNIKSGFSVRCIKDDITDRKRMR
jgi:uncharacterized protein (TIGR02145 family)